MKATKAAVPLEMIRVQYADVGFDALAHCRHLRGLGYPADTTLEIYRGETLALRCHVGRAAGLCVRENGAGRPVLKRMPENPASQAR